MIDLGGKWCILRTAGPRTLPLMRSLDDARLGAWTPVENVRRKVAGKKEKVETPTAMMPTFVFAPAVHVAELARLSRSPLNPHPSFSVWRFAGEIALVPQSQVDLLRMAEQRAVPKRRRRTIAPGTVIRPDSGAYAGLEGVVTASDGQHTLIAFGGWMNVKFETLRLLADDVEQTRTDA